MDQYIVQFEQTKYHLRGHNNSTLKDGLEAFKNIPTDLRPDMYGRGALIEDFEAEMALVLGMESAIFFPSGTMAQQIALRIHCDENGLSKVAYHPLCHLEIHENEGLKKLHFIESVLLGDSERLFTLEDLEKLENVSAVLFELPQREIGGALPSWESLVEMTNYCRNRGFKLHLDGARLFEVLPYYRKTAKEVAALFDSVYLSFYKTIGGITGAMLLGKKAFMDEARVWKRRHGGDLYRLYPYILSSKFNYDLRKDKMKLYWDHAMDYAAMLNKVPNVYTVPEVPVCNMFHVYFECPIEKLKSILVEIMQAYDLALIGGMGEVSETVTKAEIWVGDAYEKVDPERIEKAMKMLEERMR